MYQCMILPISSFRDVAACLATGTPSLERAEVLLDFAKRFELLTRAEASKISLTEIDLSDEDAIDAGLPKWVTWVDSG